MEIDLNEESIENRVVAELVDRLSESTLDKAEVRISEKIQELAEGAVEEKVAAWCDSILQRPITPIDRWGEPTGKAKTLKDMILDRALEFMEQKVDDQGRERKDNYGCKTPRYEWLVKDAVAKAIKDDTESDFNKIVNDYKKEAKTAFSKAIAEVADRQFRKL